jgi:CubicO group peptidase (beta-lactamase class C family)
MTFGTFNRLVRVGGRTALCVLTMASVLIAADARRPAHAERLLDAALLASAVERAEKLPRLHALIVARNGEAIIERAFRGPGLDAPVNVKSVSKSLISALVGIAITRGELTGPDQPIAPLLSEHMPAQADARLNRITIGHLLSMRAGLERTSGRNYGRWVASDHWVRHALSRPFADEPGGRMLYSTGNSHLLSAILSQATGRSTHTLARAWLGAPLDIDIPPWQRDPQGIYLGGNNMALSARDLFRFGELYRNGGAYRGQRIIDESWVRASWSPRTRSPFSGDEYGYGWFITRICGQAVYYARGFGGQFVHIAPSLAMTVVITSDSTTHTRIDNYRGALTSLLRDELVPAALKADGRSCNAAL